jgi:hypothetical protein
MLCCNAERARGRAAGQVQGQVLGQHTWELAKERLAARSQVTVPRMVRARAAPPSVSLPIRRPGARRAGPCLADLALLTGRLGTSRHATSVYMALLLFSRAAVLDMGLPRMRIGTKRSCSFPAVSLCPVVPSLPHDGVRMRST